jgi:hypothetical protein
MPWGSGAFFQYGVPGRALVGAGVAFFDVFWVAAVASLALVFLVFLMKRSVVETTPNKK